MTKPFDLVDLEARLKSKGLVAVEGVAKLAVNEVFAWAQESLALETNPLFSIGLPVLAALKPMALNEVDKLDGVTGD